jgi:hypothetical protein
MMTKAERMRQIQGMMRLPAMRPMAEQMLRDEKMLEHLEKMQEVRDSLLVAHTLVAHTNPQYRRAANYLRKTWDKALKREGCHNDKDRARIVEERWLKLIAKAGSKDRAAHVIEAAQEMGLDSWRKFWWGGAEKAYGAACKHIGKSIAIGAVTLIAALYIALGGPWPTIPGVR